LQELETYEDTDADASYYYSFETETVEEDESKLMDVENTLQDVAVTQETEHPSEGICWLWITKNYVCTYMFASLHVI